MRRWPARRTPAFLGIIAGLVAFAATAALAFDPLVGAGNGGVPPSAARLGPEGVPMPAGAVLAPPRTIRNGAEIDGIACQRREQVVWHTHAHLSIVVHGVSRRIPAGIGIGPPREVAVTTGGGFVVGGACFAWLHTHAADGIIHTESPVRHSYTLGQFFAVWGQALNRDRVGTARGSVTAFVDGRSYNGNLQRIPLLPHAQIQLDVGRPLTPPLRVSFPAGL